jgi:hypothetical protein
MKSILPNMVRIATFARNLDTGQGTALPNGLEAILPIIKHR